MPLQADAFTDLVFQLANSSFLPGFSGRLDATGWAAPQVFVPGGVLPGSLAFQRMHFAAIGVDPLSGQPSFVSEASSLQIWP